MVKPAVLDVLHIVDSGLWTFKGIPLKVYEYEYSIFFKLLVRVVISHES